MQCLHPFNCNLSPFREQFQDIRMRPSSVCVDEWHGNGFGNCDDSVFIVRARGTVENHSLEVG